MTEESLPGLTIQDYEDIDGLTEERLSENSQRAYKTQWRKVLGYMAKHGHPAELPLRPEALRDCLTHHAETQKIATINTMATAVKHFHEAAEYDSPTEATVVKARLTKLRRDKKDEDEGQAEPLTAEGLAKVIETACQRRPSGRGFESAENARKRGLEDIAMLWVARDALLRISEDPGAGICGHQGADRRGGNGHNSPLQDRPGEEG